MSRSKPSSSLAVVLVSLALLLGALSVRKIWNDDFFWQSATGAYVLEEGVPRHDPFSWSNPEHRRIELRWSWCVLVDVVHRHLGPGALVLMKTGLILLAFGLALAAARGWRHPLAAGVATGLALLASSQRFFVRPEVASWVLLAALVLLIHRRREKPTRWIWAAVLLHAVWANVQGLFLIGPVVLVLWLVAEAAEGLLARRGWCERDPDRPARLRTAGLVLALSLLACLVNPYGWRAYWLPILQFGVLHGTSQKDLVREMVSTFTLSTSIFAIRWFYVLLGACVVALGLGVARTLRERALGLDLFQVALVGSHLYLAASAVRNLPLFALVAIPFLVRAFGGLELRTRAVRLARGLALAGLLGYALGLLREAATDRYSVLNRDTNQFGLGIAEHRYPFDAIEFLERTGYEGRLFHSPGIGSPLIAAGFEVFIDPRFEIYMDRILNEFYTLATQPRFLDDFVQKYDVRGLVLDSYMGPFIKFAHRHPRWRAVYADETAVVFYRADTLPEVPGLDLARAGDAWYAAMRERLPAARAWDEVGWLERVTNPVPYLLLAGVAEALGGTQYLLPLYEEARRAWPEGFRQGPQLARLVQRYRGPEAAADAYAEAVSKRPNDAELLREAALLYAGLGRLEQAEAWIERSLAEDPEKPDALALAGAIALRRGRPEEALERLDEALAIHGDDPTYYTNRAEALVALQRLEDASEALREAFRLNPRSVPVAVGLGNLALDRGELEEAREWAERARALDAGSPAVQALVRRLEAGG